MKAQKTPKVLTQAQFAEKNNLSRATIHRWVTVKKLERRFKMYDARKIVVAGKIFIEQIL